MQGTSRTTIKDAIGPQPEGAPDDCCLVMIHGDDIGRRIALVDERIEFGREADCAVQLEDDTVSRRHAELWRQAEGWHIRDLQSMNGTFVNDEAHHETKVDNGDQIRVGRHIFKFIHGGNAEAAYHEVIYQLMTNDGLTQAHNRRFFITQLEREISRGARYERPLALIVFDIDNFKTINDEHGHLGGDDVLRQLAGRVLRSIRAEDVFARIGGEEFALLAPEGSADGAFTLAERLRSLIAETPFRIDATTLTVTCSFGVAHLTPKRETTTDDLYALADERLYRAKELGRNRVIDH